MLNVAIIGCGEIAEQHAAIIANMKNCKLIGVCDSEPLMAEQMAERYNVEDRFTDVQDLLSKSQPDVVHITTPPQSHYLLGEACLEVGCNIYVEKPFTMNLKEAEKLINIAKKNCLKVTVGHNLQFSHAAIKMRSLIESGYLGSQPVHMEGIYCYDFGDARYAKAMLGDKNHWVRQLPGKLLHNIINHGVCKIAEFLRDPSPTVITYGYTSDLLEGIGEKEIIDELRVIIHDKDGLSAYFTFSSQMAPKRRQFRIHGNKNAIYVDDDHQTVIKHQGLKYKSYLDKFIPPLNFSAQYLLNSISNVYKFAKCDFHMNYGMIQLIKRFYQCIENDDPPPIPYREILLTTKMMDEIFQQIYA